MTDGQASDSETDRHPCSGEVDLRQSFAQLVLSPAPVTTTQRCERMVIGTRRAGLAAESSADRRAAQAGPASERAAKSVQE